MRESGRREAVRRRREALWLGCRRQAKCGRQRALTCEAAGGFHTRPRPARNLGPRSRAQARLPHRVRPSSRVHGRADGQRPLSTTGLCVMHDGELAVVEDVGAQAGAVLGSEDFGWRSITAGACNVCSCGRRGGRRTADGGLGGRWKLGLGDGKCEEIWDGCGEIWTSCVRFLIV